MLVKARKEKGYNQEELAERIGVSRQAVSKWETGDAQPALAQLIALADALDISLDVLCGRTPSTPAAPDLSAATSPAPAGSDPTSAPADHSISLKIAFLPLVLAVLIVAGMFFHMSSTLADAEEAAVKNQLPDTIEVSGVYFYGGKNGNVEYEFTPSIVNPNFEYTISFTGFDRQTHIFTVTPKPGGICQGTADLPGGMGSYTVTLEISNGEESRVIALASGLVFEESHASWNPLVEP
ncbi:MAG: helix-turn-helix transcriptional regulator [Firmicutes bacterium]|nr:helix-turn-helix transcriptional regulator [Bacillota bacterium]